ncbi:MAG: DUF3899 domain-containing protein [Clostridiales bacterium]|nr:DUF3899 domain-containing protein [Clostridiales bacterium]MDY5468018.1 DUF3899 domain-containing protein [Eubacteriales bacterium]
MDQKKAPEQKKSLRRYLISTACALLLAALFAQIRGFSFSQPLAANLAALCDGFFVSGMLVVGLGAMIWVSTTGFFDILSYGFKNLSVLVPFHHRRKYKHFYEYKAEQAAKRSKPQFFLLVIGLIMVLIAAIFLYFYTAA